MSSTYRPYINIGRSQTGRQHFVLIAVHLGVVLSFAVYVITSRTTTIATNMYQNKMIFLRGSDYLFFPTVSSLVGVGGSAHPTMTPGRVFMSFLFLQSRFLVLFYCSFFYEHALKSAIILKTSSLRIRVTL